MAVKNFVLRENSVDNKVAGMKATFFAIFDPKMDPYLGLKKTQIRNSFNSILVKKKTNYIIIKCSISSYICLKFPLKCWQNHNLVPYKVFPMQNMEKNLLIMPVFLTFFTNFDLIWPKFWLKTTPTLLFSLVSNEIC